MLERVWRKGPLLPFSQECQSVPPPRTAVWRYLLNNYKRNCHTALGAPPEKTEDDTRTPAFTAARPTGPRKRKRPKATGPRNRKRPKCPSAEERMRNVWHTYMTNTQLHKKKENMPGRTWRSLCDLEWSKPERERQRSCDIAYMWTLKINGTKELIYKTARVEDSGNKPTVTRGEGRWGRGRDKLRDWDWHIHTICKIDR